jgi:hypothetical protein
LAKLQNVHWGRWEAFWAGEQTSVVDLIQPADAFDKMIYTLTNPVKDHLVERATVWTGQGGNFTILGAGFSWCGSFLTVLPFAR